MALTTEQLKILNSRLKNQADALRAKSKALSQEAKELSAAAEAVDGARWEVEKAIEVSLKHDQEAPATAQQEGASGG